jgi:hypothetical protein
LTKTEKEDDQDTFENELKKDNVAQKDSEEDETPAEEEEEPIKKVEKPSKKEK